MAITLELASGLKTCDVGVHDYDESELMIVGEGRFVRDGMLAEVAMRGLRN